MFFYFLEVGIEVFEILFFSYYIRYLGFDNGDVYFYLVLKNKSFGVCIRLEFFSLVVD